MKFLVLLLAIALSFPAVSQSNYNDYPNNLKTEIFKDDFDFNANKLWVGNQGNYSGSIQNGYYKWQSSYNSSMYVPIAMDIDDSKDFQLETSLKLAAGEQNYPQSFMWSFDSESKWAFHFDVTNTQYFRIYLQEDIYEEIIPWTYSSTIKKNAYNRLTVRKVGHNMYFFINKILVHTMSEEPLLGDYAAISVPQYSTLHVDYVHAHYLKKKQVVIHHGGGKSLDPSTYNSYTSSHRDNVLYDDFSSNAKNWWQGSSTSYYANIQSGYMLWQSKINNSHSLPYKLPQLDEHKDYEIEMKVKFAAGSGTDHGFGLKWGKPDGDWHGYNFLITNTGYYRIYKSQDYPEEYVPWTESSLIRQYAYNTLTVRKVDRMFYYFLNGQLIHSMPSQSFLGNQLAFICPGNATIHVDNFRVSHLKKAQHQEENIAPSIFITEPVLSRGFKVIEVDTKTTHIAGIVHDSDGIHQVLVNGQRAALQSDGKFSIDLALHEGSNSILVKATDKLMKSSVKSFTIDHEEKSRVTASQKRLALVIGNSSYSNAGSLKNPINDAVGMKTELEKLGFEVLKYEDCDQRTMKKAIDDFGRKLQGYDVGLFFYAGHGLQVKGNNYLIPTDAKLTQENEVEYDCVRADRVLMVMESAKTKTNLVILDACRNNPFERSWSRSGGGNGLAFMNAPKGSLIAYATSPGNTASDGQGDNGLYTAALLKEISKPNITILEMFQNVRAKVVQDSHNGQTPWESTSLIGNFYFKKE